jgi:hypothetical protein
MTKPVDYLVAAAVSQMRAADNSAFKTLDDLKNAIEEKFSASIDGNRLFYLAKVLQAYGFISIVSDEYAGDYITPLSGWGVSYRLNKIKEQNSSHGIIYALDGGDILITRAFQNPKFWADLDAQTEQNIDEVTQVELEATDEAPASDRIVHRDKSRVEIEVIEADIRGLVEEIESNNEVSIELGNDKELLTGELKTAETLIGQPVFRLSTMSNLAMPVLRYLADKFASGAIGELAKRLIAALIGLN